MARGAPDRRVRRAAGPGRARARARGASRSGSAGTATSPPHGWTCLGLAEGVRRPRADAEPAGHLPRGVRARRRARPRRATSARSCSARRSSRFGTEEQQQRFLPAIARRRGAVVPGLLRARRRLRPGQRADHARGSTATSGRQRPEGLDVARARRRLVLRARAAPSRARRGTSGLSYLLVPMDQPGVEVRPIIQLTGTSEFNEVFFDGARTRADLVVGERGDGWRVAMGTLGFERGVSTLGQQLGFARELAAIVDAARERNGAADDPVIRDRLAAARGSGCEVMRCTRAARPSPRRARASRRRRRSPSCSGRNWHRGSASSPWTSVGPWSSVADASPYELTTCQRLFLFTRADTIYGGSNEIQRNIIAERVLGLPATEGSAR